MKLYRIMFEPEGQEQYIVEVEISMALKRAFLALDPPDAYIVTGVTAEIVVESNLLAVKEALERKAETPRGKRHSRISVNEDA